MRPPVSSLGAFSVPPTSPAHLRIMLEEQKHADLLLMINEYLTSMKLFGAAQALRKESGMLKSQWRGIKLPELYVKHTGKEEKPKKEIDDEKSQSTTVPGTNESHQSPTSMQGGSSPRLPSFTPFRIGEASSMVTKECIATLYGHTEAVTTLHSTRDLLLSSSEDGLIKLWDPFSWQCVQSIPVHSKTNVIKHGYGYILCGSEDGKITLLDASTKLFAGCLERHSGAVKCIEICEEIFFSGGNNPVILMWNSRSMDCIGKLSGHTDDVLTLHFVSGLLFSGSKDRTIKAWDIGIQRNVRTMDGHQSWVTCLASSNQYLFSGSDDRSIRIWDLDTLDAVGMLSGHLSSVRALKFCKDLLFSCSDDGFVRIWDVHSRSCTKMLDNTDSGGVLTISIMDGAVFTGSRNGTIKAWSKRERTILPKIGKGRSNTAVSRRYGSHIIKPRGSPSPVT